MNTELTPPPATEPPVTDAPTTGASGTTETSTADITAPLPAPRIRVAAIVWGLVFAAAATVGIWLLADDRRRDDAADWMTSLTPSAAFAAVLLSIGVLVLVTGATGLLRHAQRRSSESSL